MDNSVLLPVHPSYNESGLPTALVRPLFSNREAGGDPTKAARQILRVTDLKNPPLRLALGKDALSWIETSLKEILTELKEYDFWSDDLD